MKDDKPIKRNKLPRIRLADIFMEAGNKRKSGKSIVYTAGFIAVNLSKFMVFNIITVVDDTLDVRDAAADYYLDKLAYDSDGSEIKSADSPALDKNSRTVVEIQVNEELLSQKLSKIENFANVIYRKGGSVKFDGRQLVNKMLYNYNPDDRLQHELCMEYLVNSIVNKSGIDQKASTLKTIYSYENFPSSFQVAAQVVNAISNSEYDARLLTDIIESDPALSMKLIKLANSSFYRREYKVVTTFKAVSNLGSRIIRSIAIAAALKEQKLLCDSFDYERFWKTTRARSIAARYYVLKQLGKRLDQCDESEIERIDRAFTAGLLSKFGKLVYATVWPYDYSVINVTTNGKNLSLKKREIERFGLDHNNLTEDLMKNWGFSKDIYNSVLLQDVENGNSCPTAEKYEVLNALKYAPGIMGVLLESIDNGIIPKVGPVQGQSHQANYPVIPSADDIQLMMQQYKELAEII